MRTISTALTGPLTLGSTDNPLTITSTGSVTSVAAGSDGIDGKAGTAWSITNAGKVSSATGYAISCLLYTSPSPRD